MKGTVFVTGGAGFIGSHLVEALLREGSRVLCLDNFNDFYDPAVKRENLKGVESAGGFTLVEGDIRDVETVRELFRRERPRAVVHLAAMAGVRPSLEDPRLYHDVNVMGTLSLLEAAREFPVENFLFGSSSSVYGSRLNPPFRETDRVDRPISPYAATKAEGELLCHTFHHLYGIPITCLRFFTVYGPRQRPDLAIHKFARLMAAGEPIPLFGDGTTRRDYTYIDDIIQGVMGALERPLGYEILNLGESRTVTLQELVRLLEENMGLEARIRRLPEQPGDVPLTCADVSRAGDLVGYRPQVPIEEGIRRFVRWFREGRENRR